jgi:5-methylcytosine-specific restriction enzyme A
MHKRGHRCAAKPKDNRVKESNEINRFRWSRRWSTKSKQIRERDRHLCQACLHLVDGTVNQYTFNNLEVHHIEPLHEAFDRRLDDSNLVSLCVTHHKMAEDNEIDKDILFAFAEKNILKK